MEKFQSTSTIISSPLYINGAKNCVKVSSIHRLAIDALDDVHPLVDQWPPVATRTTTPNEPTPSPSPWNLFSFRFVPSVNHFRAPLKIGWE